jgi:two-component system, chemotaxis family, chemotaxis protein CheY
LKKFLIVDDSSTMRKIVSLALSGAGHEFSEAENGRLALDQAGSGGFDCIILDINMPEMNGIEFLEARSKVAALAPIPVIVLTTQDEEELRKRALSLGAKAFLVKPFKKEDLIATIGSIGLG